VSSDKVLLVDGHSLAFRAFYGFPAASFSTSTGQFTNAVYGFVSLLTAVIRTEQPTHIGVAFDKSRITFRTAEYPAYKATRSATPEEFKGQVELIKDVLTALGIVHVEVDDYEGDDIIATWSTQACQADMEVLIQSGDRDSYQLINDHVTVLYPGRPEVVRKTPEAIQEEYGLPPQRYPELAALTGETSDNLPGVPGVGPKTAAKWLNEFDGLENLLRRADQVKGKAGESLREHIDDVVRNRRLNALVTDVDLPVKASGLVRGEADFAALNCLFDTLEFGAIRKEVQKVFAPAQPQAITNPEPVVEAVATLTSGKVGTWLTAHGVATVGLWLDGSWGRGAWDLTSLSIASSDGAVAWIDVATLTPADEKALSAWLADKDVHKVVHDAKEQVIAAGARGWKVEGIVCDTALAAYLANPDRRAFSLDSLAQRYLDRSVGATDQVGDQPSFDFETSASATLDGHRARTILDLDPLLAEELDEHEATHLLTDLELPLQGVLGRMERLGIAVDEPFLDTLSRQFDDRVAQAERDAYEALGHETNLSSPKQLQGVLFDELKMPKTRRTKSGFTTDAEALEWLYTQTAHPFLEHLLAHRDQIKLRQSVDGLIKSVADDGRIHTTYLQTAAATGRLSSQDPNLQNIPVRTPAGFQIRQGFVAGKGYEALMTADYSQIEMRIMAHVSGDAGLIEAFRSGQDFHTVMAARVFGIPAGEVTPAQRSRVKAVNYGLAYGLSAYGLSGQLKIPVSEATHLMEGYFSQFGGVRDYLQSLVAQARHTGYTETLLGRRRYLPDLNSLNRTRRDMAERMALNAPIQGTAADIIKVAMLRVQTALDKGFRSRMLLQVHDELVLEVASGEVESLEAMIREQMGNAIELAVPLDVSVGVGASWASAAH
jgi:DNA polymerase-1